MALLLLTTCLACAPASDEGDRETADSGGMAQADATRSLGVVFELASTGQVTEGDPYADGPTSPAPCRGWGLEDTYLEINTDLCPYGTFEVPLLVDLPTGASLLATFWHASLTAPDGPASAHVAMRLGGSAIADETIAIPAVAEVYERTLTLAAPLAAGTPLFIHVHNHGANSYRFAPISAIVP